MQEKLTEYMMQAERHALAKYGYCGHAEWSACRNKRFAELIAQECASLCTDEYHTQDGWGITDADRRCSDLIRAHFGVK
jgi:hypothetical protein